MIGSTTFSRDSASGSNSTSSEPPPRKPTRRDWLPVDLQDPSNAPTLEYDIDLDQELKQRLEAARYWQVLYYPIEELILPPKIVHPAAPDYIGSEIKSRPKYLWDSHKRATVLAEDYMFEEGYVAISYTWGRWREGDRQIPGTRWRVPSTGRSNPDFPNMACNFQITKLMDILCRMRGTRYFWVDVLCINQYPQTETEKAEKTKEIAKQAAIFKEAKGVLVYLWFIDNGAQFAAAMNELGEAMRWYWEIAGPQGSEITKRDGRAACIDANAQILRKDPWFSSLWTLQEMILAPASTWMARDGSHCQVNGHALTTHTVADKFQDFIFLERFHDQLRSNSHSLAFKYVESQIPKSEKKLGDLLRIWLKWAFQETSITTCIGDSRGGILLATMQRKYTARRESAVLAPLRVGNDKEYDKESDLVSGFSVSLWNELIQAEGGRLFDNHHTSGGPLTNMLPTDADVMSSFAGIRCECTGWKMTKHGQLKIPQGSSIAEFSESKETKYQLGERTIEGGHPEDTVKSHLAWKKIKVHHVRFVTIGCETPLSLGKGNVWVFTAVRGVILVTTSSDIDGENCLWYKAGPANWIISSQAPRLPEPTPDVSLGEPSSFAANCSTGPADNIAQSSSFATTLLESCGAEADQAFLGCIQSSDEDSFDFSRYPAPSSWATELRPLTSFAGTIEFEFGDVPDIDVGPQAMAPEGAVTG